MSQIRVLFNSSKKSEGNEYIDVLIAITHPGSPRSRYIIIIMHIVFFILFLDW